MDQFQLNGIYLHGYQGFVTDEKKNYLQQLGNIYAPKIDYDLQPTILFQLYDQFKEEKLDFISGTSLGGILSYHLALMLDIPCLLLNPAVIAMSQIKAFIPEMALNQLPKKDVIVLVGMKDEIVSPKLQLDYFRNVNAESHQVKIIINEDLKHFVPLDVFEDTFNFFAENILKKAY